MPVVVRLFPYLGWWKRWVSGRTKHLYEVFKGRQERTL